MKIFILEVYQFAIDNVNAWLIPMVLYYLINLAMRYISIRNDVYRVYGTKSRDVEKMIPSLFSVVRKYFILDTLWLVIIFFGIYFGHRIAL